MDENLIIWLQNWFQSNCNGDWEHGCTIKIANLDNPGWYVYIDLEGTDMENIIFQTVDIEKSETDWIFCQVECLQFKGTCGSLNLLEMLEIFRSWLIFHHIC